MAVALYSGREAVPDSFWAAFDYLKIGPYRPSCGPLNKPTTNQRLYRILPDGSREDMTPRFWHRGISG